MPKSVLATIEGMVPSIDELGPGCRFAGRCPLADERCRREQPPLAFQGPGHEAACWHSDAVASLVRSAA
jgi:peptide/nickel transport system ATP-binding protein